MLHDFLFLLLAITHSVSSSARTRPQHLKRPHIVFMLVDDLGWSDVSFHGSKQIPTPNIDALARDGVILNQYYVQALCSPSRGSLMTGKYPIQIGLQHGIIHDIEPWGLPLEEKILPEYLKELNYATHIIGKWHLGFFKKEYTPRMRGFDSFYGFYNGLKDYYTHFSSEHEEFNGLDLHKNEKNVWYYNGTYGTDLFTAKAKKVIRKHDPSKPLFLYLAHQAPHTGNFWQEPLQAPKKYVDPMVGIDDKGRQIFAGMVSAMDFSVGEIFEALETSGLLDDTIFVFSSDNGGSPEGPFRGKGSNWPLKGTKATLWEGGVRGASFIWSPFLRNRSRIYDELMHISDWLPTLLSAAGGPAALAMLPKSIVGVDQWPSLANDLPSPRKEILLNIDSQESSAGIRKGRYKLVKAGTYELQYNKWYDQDGREFNSTHYSIRTPSQKKTYEQNYARFLKKSKAASILKKKYGRDPRLAADCITTSCKKQLEVDCSLPFPETPTCNSDKGEYCLYDIVKDPCEFTNIAAKMPEMVTELELAIQKYELIAIPSGEKPKDPLADPKLHGNAWVPWR